MHSRESYMKGPASNAGGEPMEQGKAKVAKVMREYKQGKLKSSGKKVKDKKQAKAIALSGMSKAMDEGIKKGLNRY